MHVKVIASLGPSSRDYEIIKEMVQAGASGFRINFSHGDQDFWKELINKIRRVEEELNTVLTIITDLKGSSIRLGTFPQPIRVKAGETLKLSPDTFSPEDKVIPLPERRVIEKLEEGDLIVMDDGRVRMRVVEVSGGVVKVEALTDAIIKPEKGLAVKGKEFDLPSITEKDLHDLEFACSAGVDYIGLSYVRSAKDVLALRGHMKRLECDAGIIAKIETRSAVTKLEEIVGSSDITLVARGDLGMNYSLEEIPVLQSRIVKTALRAGKPVMIATQLLESMVENPIPTRAEVMDVFNAVREGVDALMLTGETAAGRYPVEAVKWLIKIACKAEEGWFPKVERLGGSLKKRYAEGVAELAEDLNAKLIIYSLNGNTAKYLSSVRPRTEVYVGVPTREVGRKVNILWGLQPIIISASNYNEGLENTYSELISRGVIGLGDISILTYGLREYEQVIKVRRRV